MATVLKRHGVRWIEGLALLPGIGCLVWASMTWAHTAIYQLHVKDQLDHVLTPAPASDAAERPGTGEATSRADSLIGLFEIRRLGVSVAVLEGEDERTVRVAVGHLPDTALPWKDGNTALAGHRDSSGAARYGGPLALLILDSDGLKRINDQRGHQAGDCALQSVASAIRDELREVDVAARLGGDEFGVLAPRTGDTAAIVPGNRVRALAADRLASAVGQPFTVSVGAACLGATESRSGTPNSLMMSADAALYEAKRQGVTR